MHFVPQLSMICHCYYRGSTEAASSGVCDRLCGITLLAAKEERRLSRRQLRSTIQHATEGNAVAALDLAKLLGRLSSMSI
jgi:hypothetical protein